jgi:hypothetical protein
LRSRCSKNILKLREDYKAKLGSGYKLQGFHDAFIKLGPLPIPDSAGDARRDRRAVLTAEAARSAPCHEQISCRKTLIAAASA